jgi:thioredoxin reductase
MQPLLAILGAGPVGIEAALVASRSGFRVVVYEAGRAGEHLRRFAHVRLFTPFAMNSTPLGREALLRAGATLPEDDALLTAGALVEDYLEPLVRALAPSVALRGYRRVTHVGREGASKGSPPTRGGIPRGSLPFLLRVEREDGGIDHERADFVIDATGVYGSPSDLGPGGLPADGQESLGGVLERHIPDLRDVARDRYAGRRVLLLGSGHSAATALLELEALAGQGAGAEVHWIHRDREPCFREVPADPLPARSELARRANSIARSAPWLRRHPGAEVAGFVPEENGAVTALVSENGSERRITVDRVLALVGYRPDLGMTRELRVHHCYESEGPMKLAAAIQAADGGSGDCLAQVSHGPASLETPEPGFCVIGAKSYGRRPDFLLSVGHQQARDAVALIAVARARSAGTMNETQHPKGDDGWLETTETPQTTT